MGGKRPESTSSDLAGIQCRPTVPSYSAVRLDGFPDIDMHF